jgi:hypothetical protein
LVKFLKKILFLLLFCTSIYVQAQRNGSSYPGAGGNIGNSGSQSGNSSNFQNPNTDPTKEGEEELDTVKVAYFYAAFPSKKIPFSDTLLANDFQHYTAIRGRRAEYAYLGMAGSAHHPIVWQTAFREGFDVGIHSFDLFRIDNQSIKYYQTNKAFSQAKWTFRSIGNDSNFDFDYGSQFSNNNYVSLEWHRSNQSKDPNYNFKGASALNTNWAVGYGHIGKKHSIFVSFANNNAQQTHNGGIAAGADTFMLKTGFPGNYTIDTKLPNVLNLRYKVQNIQIRQTYKLNRANDSLAITKRAFLITHIFDYQHTTNKNYYTFSGLKKADSLFFQDFINDRRGLRVFFDVKKIENQLSVGTQKPRTGQLPDVIEIGLKHRFYNIYFEPKDSQINHIFAFGKWNFGLSKWLKINTYAHFGLLPANAAEYCLKGDLQLNLQKLGVLEATFMQQRYQPSLLQTRMYSFQLPVWRHDDFSKSFSTTLSASYRLPALNFAATGSYHLLNNYIYFDKTLQPLQTNKAVNILQLELLQDIHIRKLHIENYLAFQKSTNDAVQLPTIYGKHSIYVEGKLFRKGAMLARLGADFRYTTAYNADAFNPLINQFYTQTDSEIPFYPALDVYVSARVLKLRAFVKMENITSIFYKKAIFFTVPNYPLYNTYLRFGFYRRFTD